MPLIFIIRRVIFCLSIVLTDGQGFPTLMHFWSCWVMIEFLICADAYEKRINTYIDIFNEIVLCILMTFILGFTSWMPIIDYEESEFKLYLGWVFVGIVLLHIILHFVIMVRESCKNTETYTKETVKKNKDMRKR